MSDYMAAGGGGGGATMERHNSVMMGRTNLSDVQLHNIHFSDQPSPSLQVKVTEDRSQTFTAPPPQTARVLDISFWVISSVCHNLFFNKKTKKRQVAHLLLSISTKCKYTSHEDLNKRQKERPIASE